MTNFLVGLGIGFGMGVLFAPKSGEETRSDLTARANEFVDTAKHSFGEAKDRVQRSVKAFQSGVETATGSQG
ncbi:MAG TPA: YtxH domain-containing protein [Candidatus Angelobacter sp.]|jgi:gas vesicle protein|nr:YtxH domain-containing protein [Candidatus Angelobacter sp.]